MENTHITWSIERGGRCPKCGGEPRLVVAPPNWSAADAGDTDYEIEDEVSGHYCPACSILVSLSLNTSMA
jgi:hypothetical protein